MRAHQSQAVEIPARFSYNSPEVSSMTIREIRPEETSKLLPCIVALAEYHNRISTNFKGQYPRKPGEAVLESFEKDLKDGVSHIAVLEDNGVIVGFCKIDIVQNSGKLDYLIVLPEYRGSGCGAGLMDWAMAAFHANGIRHIEVKVVDGNDAIRFYEKYGFKINAHLLWYAGD